ncbi:hypothetical protein HY947_03715, partial [Candidatus Gottesmanbacteria bacterium]|nr:hypothetical protein [Candidatus Gottesmanbacteria bacterium]
MSLDEIKNPEDELAVSLLGWEIANEKALGLWRDGKSLTDLGDQWDATAFDLHNNIDSLLWHGIPRDAWDHPDMINGETIEILKEHGYGMVNRLMGNDAFPAHAQLVKYVNYNLWLSWRHMILSGNDDLSNTETPNYMRAKAEFTNKKALLVPMLQDASVLATKGSRKDEMRNIFEGLLNVEARDEASKFLFDARVNNDERLAMAVEHINVFGLVPT